MLLVREKVSASQQRAAGLVERVGLAAPVAVDLLLDPPPAKLEGIPCQPDYVERIHDRSGFGDLLGCGYLEPP